MNIVVKDEGRYIDIFVDGVHSASLEVLDEGWKLVFTNDALHMLVLHGLFNAIMAQRKGEWSNS